jgi:hypothetical protein
VEAVVAVRRAARACFSGEALPDNIDLEMRWIAGLRHGHTARMVVTLDHERFPFA